MDIMGTKIFKLDMPSLWVWKKQIALTGEHNSLYASVHAD